MNVLRMVGIESRTSTLSLSALSPAAAGEYIEAVISTKVPPERTATLSLSPHPWSRASALYTAPSPLPPTHPPHHLVDAHQQHKRSKFMSVSYVSPRSYCIYPSSLIFFADVRGESRIIFISHNDNFLIRAYIYFRLY